MLKHSSQEPKPIHEEVLEPENTGENPEETGQGGAPRESGEEAKAASAGAECKEQSGDEECGAEKRVAELEVEVAELKDQYLRKAADFENFRKRMNREKQDAIEFANQALLLDLVLVIDDFERAIKSAETSRDFNSFYEGIGMIEKQLLSQLENKWGLKRFDSAGEAFDPARHEAIMMEKSPEASEPVVAEDFIKGYTLKERVIRAAKVKVIMPENPEQK